MKNQPRRTVPQEIFAFALMAGAAILLACVRF